MSLFLPNIPQPNQNLDFSQGQLLSNNSGLDTVFSVDHTLFSDSTANKGFHKKVTLYQVATDPAQAFPGAEVYTKNSGITPNRITDLFFSSKPETGADKVLQLTSTALVTANGEGFMPGGLQIRAGTGSAPTPVTFMTKFPTACISVVATTNSSGSQVNVTAISATGFTVVSPSGGLAYYWIAVGY